MLVSVQNGIDPDNNLGMDSLIFDIPIKYLYLVGITILIPKGEFIDTSMYVD